MPSIENRERSRGAFCLGLPLTVLIAVACAPPKPAAAPPSRVAPPPPGLFQTDKRLVDLRVEIPGLAIELPYATRRNISGTRLYPREMPALLDRPTAAKLKRAQAELAKSGLGLKIWDAYRPPEVQWELWRRSGKSGYVADPRQWWSKHCSGRAVDVTLINLETRRDLRMPSRFDDFSQRASSIYKGDDPEIRRNLSLLAGAMRRAGFKGIQMEWWHFANATHYGRNIAPISAARAGVDLSHLGDKIKTFDDL